MGLIEHNNEGAILAEPYLWFYQWKGDVLVRKKVLYGSKKYFLVRRRLKILQALWSSKAVKPIDIGAWDASHHHDDLNAMVNLDLVARMEVGGGFIRNTYRYYRTPRGTELLRKNNMVVYSE
jgi:hypothetical protein